MSVDFVIDYGALFQTDRVFIKHDLRKARPQAIYITQKIVISVMEPLSPAYQVDFKRKSVSPIKFSLHNRILSGWSDQRHSYESVETISEICDNLTMILNALWRNR